MMKQRALSFPARIALLGALGLVAVCLILGLVLSAVVAPEKPHTLDTGRSDLTDAENGKTVLLKGTENGEYFAANRFPTLYGAVGDDPGDDTAALRSALQDAKTSGGTVYLPAGTYRISEPLIIPEGVCLRGDFTSPDASRSQRTVLSVPDGDAVRGAPLFTLEEGASIIGLTIYYEGQQPLSPVEYPVTVYCTGSAHAERLALVNPYHGICVTGQGDVTVSSVWMSPLDYGVLVTDNTNTVLLEDISVSPVYWLNSVPEAFADREGAYEALTQHLSTGLHGFILEKVSDVTFSRCSMDDGAVGMLLNVPAEQDSLLLISECEITAVPHPLRLKSLPKAGVCFSDCLFRPDSDVGANTVELGDTVQAPVVFSACSFSGSPKTVISGKNPSFVSFYYCDFGTWWNSCFNMDASTFLAVSPSFHTDADRAILGLNGFGLLYGSAPLEDSSELLFSVTTENAVLSGSSSVKGLKDSAAPLPAKVISAAAFGVAPHNADNTAALAEAFASLGEGGGLVFLPEGEYHFISSITVPSAVRLVGVGAEGKYKTSLVFPSVEEDAPALVVLEKGASLESLELRAPEGKPLYGVYSSAEQIRLSHLSLSAVNGIGLSGAKNAFLAHLSVRASSVGISLDSCTNALLRDIRFSDSSSNHTLTGIRCESSSATLSRLYSDRLSAPLVCGGTSSVKGTLNVFRRVQQGITVEGEANLVLTALGLYGTGEGSAPSFLNISAGSLTVQGMLCCGAGAEGQILSSQGGTATLRGGILSAACSVSVLSQGEGDLSVSGCIWNNTPQYHVSATKGTVSVSGNLLVSDKTFEGIEGEYLLFSAAETATVDGGINVMKYIYVEQEEGGSESGSGDISKEPEGSSPSLGGHEPQ